MRTALWLRPLRRAARLALAMLVALALLAPHAVASAQSSPTIPWELPALGPMEIVEVGGGVPLTLDEVIASTERHHPILEAASQRVVAADGARLSAEGAFDLTLGARGSASVLGYYENARVDVTLTQPTPLWGATVFGGWRLGRGLSDGGIPPYYGYDQTLDGGELRVGATVPLWRDGPIDARRAALWRAEHGVDAAREDREARSLRLTYAATEAYVRWVAAGQRYRVALALLSLAEERDAQIAARAQAGAIPPIEHLENRRAILERRQGAVAARRVVEQRALALSLYLRADDGSPVVVDVRRLPETLAASAHSPGTEEEDVAAALGQRPDARRFAALRRAAEVSVALADNQLSPRVDLSVTGSMDVGGAGTADAERAYDLQRTLERPQLDAMLSVQVPLQFREARGRIEQARAELAALDADYELALDQIALEVRDARSAVRAATDNVALARQSAEVARLVAEAERARFEAGATSLLVVNLREAAAAAAAQGAIDAMADLEVARAGWAAATATR